MKVRNVLVAICFMFAGGALAMTDLEIVSVLESAASSRGSMDLDFVVKPKVEAPDYDSASWSSVIVRAKGKDLLTVRYQSYPGVEAGKEGFVRQKVFIATGAGRILPFQIGDEAVTAGEKRLLVRRNNTVFWINAEERIDDPLVKALALALDEKIR